MAPRLILAHLYPHQMALADSPSRRRAVIASRRAGKSVACGAMAHALCQQSSKRVLWLSLTLTNIRRIAEDSVHLVCDWGGAPPTLNRSRWVYEYPNGSQIEIAGCDTTLDAAERYAGAGYDLIIIDEVGSVDPDQLDYLIDSILWPALLDRQGVLVLVGTPRRKLAGRFHAVTSEPEKWPRWEVVRWSTDQNDAVAAQWKEEIESLSPEQRTLASTRRELYGEWVDEVGDTWYHWQLVTREPTAPDKQTMILGIDFGYTNPNGFALLGWSPHDRRLFIHRAWSASGWTTTRLADEIRGVMLDHPGVILVGDPAAAQVIADLSRLHGIHIQSADKHDVDGTVEAINDDASSGRLVALPGAQPLLDEMADLDIVRKGNRLVPNPGKPDHICDAFRYAWRRSRHRVEEPEPRRKTEAERMMEREMEEAVRRQRRRFR